MKKLLLVFAILFSITALCFAQNVTSTSISQEQLETFAVDSSPVRHFEINVWEPEPLLFKIEHNYVSIFRQNHYYQRIETGFEGTAEALAVTKPFNPDKFEKVDHVIIIFHDRDDNSVLQAKYNFKEDKIIATSPW
jgi:hypothetical protein